MKTTIPATIISILLTLVASRTLKDKLKPTEDVLKIIFPDEYDNLNIQKIGKAKTAPKKCAGEKCTLEEIYEIFDLDPQLITPSSRLNETDDRAALGGDDCPTGYVRISNTCTESV